MEPGGGGCPSKPTATGIPCPAGTTTARSARRTPPVDEPAQNPAEPDRAVGHRDGSPPSGPRFDLASAREPEMEDDGPDPELDPDVEQQVRALLAGEPNPGPMPHEVSERISAALTGAARLRDDRAPFAPVPVRSH